ncbi:WxL protein host-binding domain-containing protein [Bacillus sp. N9]
MIGTYKIENISNETLYKGDFGSFDMAPKSQIHYPLSMNISTLIPGEYVLSIHATLMEELLIERFPSL